MTFIKSIKNATKRVMTGRQEHIPSELNPIRAPRVKDGIKQLAKMRRKDVIDMIENFLVQAKKDYIKVITKNARTKADIKTETVKLDMVIGKQREEMSNSIADFIVNTPNITQKAIGEEVNKMGHQVMTQITQKMEDRTVNGDSTPNRTAIIEKIGEAQEAYLKVIAQQRKFIQDYVLADLEMSTRDRVAKVQEADQKIFSLKGGILQLCNSLKKAVGVYQSAISKQAILEQNKVAKLSHWETIFKETSAVFDKLNIPLNIPATITQSLQSAFTALISYHSLQEPVAAEQNGAKLLLQTVLDECNKLLAYTDVQYNTFQTTTKGWIKEITRQGDSPSKAKPNRKFKPD